MSNFAVGIEFPQTCKKLEYEKYFDQDEIKEIFSLDPKELIKPSAFCFLANPPGKSG